jgi:hypothetical protein
VVGPAGDLGLPPEYNLEPRCYCRKTGPRLAEQEGSAWGHRDSIDKLVSSRGSVVSFPYCLTLHRAGVRLLLRKCRSCHGERCGRLGKLLDCFHSPRWGADWPGISSEAVLAFSHVTLALLVFHPRWTLPSFYRPDCVFANVQASQFVLATIVLMLGYRMVGHTLTQRQRFAVAVAACIGGVAAGAAVGLIVAQFPTHSWLKWRYFLPSLVPFLLIAGITTGFLVAVGLGATRLLMSLLQRARRVTKSAAQ